MFRTRTSYFVLAAVAVIGAVVWIGSIFPQAGNQGYSPEQPIPFSHKIHAGDFKMDCRYCHSAVTHSIHATIPAMSVCMNCHNQVKTDSPHIKKLAEAFYAGRPIEWVRVHEVQDFVRFSHRPHVNIGIECESCHGDVKKMDRIEQIEPLTMGWCLKCHRGETTPKKVIAKLRHKPTDNREPLASQDCDTCHF